MQQPLVHGSTVDGLTPSRRTLPFRKTFMVVEGLTALGGAMGSLMLISGSGTPPVSVLNRSV
jgi:hypothetical protein